MNEINIKVRLIKLVNGKALLLECIELADNLFNMAFENHIINFYKKCNIASDGNNIIINLCTNSYYIIENKEKEYVDNLYLQTINILTTMKFLYLY